MNDLMEFCCNSGNTMYKKKLCFKNVLYELLCSWFTLLCTLIVSDDVTVV